MITLNLIEKFLEPKKLAIAGVSRDSKKFGAVVFNDLKKKGFEIYPINPNVDEIYGEKCYRSVDELPTDAERLFIATPKKETAEVIKKAAEKGIKMIWIQLSADTPEAIEIAAEKNIELIYKKCIYMFAEPVESVHKFHRFCVKLFGSYPKIEKAG
ncbi:MAG: CoA-binding protein [Prolixibacteraceae bacterium]|nr:CoA-binding protein [Prolixibacteraceae bacterium]MBN2773873.1 CoA-binding protein [Prolixibacteraceae bacterium]